MRKKIIGCILVLSFGALLSGGCAKKDMVRTDEPIPAYQTPATPETTTPRTDEAPDSLKSQPMIETPTSDSSIKQEPAAEETPGTQISQLQSELQKIYFNFDAADLSEDARSVLLKNAELLLKNPSVKVKIEGNCDERGSDDYNMALGERRAQAARDYLVNLGVQPDRLSTISYGEENPAEQGEDEATMAKNRRAEFVIVK